MSQPYRMARDLQPQVRLQQMPALVPAVIGPQTLLLHLQQLGLDAAAQHKLLAAVKLVQLRDHIHQQVVQLSQDVVAFSRVRLAFS